MNGHGDKKVRVGRFDYTLDVSDENNLETIVASIRAALDDGTVVAVPVLDEKRNRMTLYINGGRVDALVIDLDLGPKPGELAP